jgi:hypothetical protein
MLAILLTLVIALHSNRYGSLAWSDWAHVLYGRQSERGGGAHGSDSHLLSKTRRMQLLISTTVFLSSFISYFLLFALSIHS